MFQAFKVRCIHIAARTSLEETIQRYPMAYGAQKAGHHRIGQIRHHHRQLLPKEVLDLVTSVELKRLAKHSSPLHVLLITMNGMDIVGVLRTCRKDIDADVLSSY